VSWFQGTPTEFCYSWILPLYFRASVPLLWVCLAHVPGSPRTGWRPPWVGGGVNTCMCLRGAAGFLRPGRLQPVRGGATPAERPFPRSEQRRRKIGGDLAPPPQKDLREWPGTGGRPFSQVLVTSPTPPHSTVAPGRWEGKVHPLHPLKCHTLARVQSGWGGGSVKKRRWPWWPKCLTVCLVAMCGSLKVAFSLSSPQEERKP
jgi:hypothetical protein